MPVYNRMILTNETPNDQGGIVRNNTIDWSRFAKNPVMLYHHGNEPGIKDLPIGHWSDLQFDGISWTALPTFSKIPEAKKYETLYLEGNLKASSIGGVCHWKKDSMGRVIESEEGLKESEYFQVYEASLVPLPSNENAIIKLNSIKIYNDQEIVKLNSIIMQDEKNVEKQEDVKTIPVQSEDGKVSQNFVLTLLNTVKTLFATDPVKHFKDEPDGDEPPISKLKDPDKNTDSKPNGQMETDRSAKNEKAVECAMKIAECETEADLEAEIKKLEADYGEEMPSVIKKAIEKKKSNFKTKLASKMPEQKDETQLAGEKIVPIPNVTHKINFGEGVKYTELSAKEDGKKIIEKVLYAGGNATDSSAHRVVLNSILEDKKFKALKESISFTDNSPNRTIPKSDITELAARLNSGSFDTMNFKTGRMEKYQEFGSSADLLATPDLLSVEWVNMLLFKLYPTFDWKAEIPLFSAQSSSKNLGLIFTNVNSDPTIYKGSRPVSPTVHEYDDTPVALTLMPFFMQSILWTPQQLAMLRTDKMATGWSQALNKFFSTIDDFLIYQLLSQMNKTVYTSGESFTISNVTDDDSFVLNPAFTGSLAKPLLNDVLKIRQIFNKQNFPLDTKFVLVNDPTMDKYITADKETKSKLTQFVNVNGVELLSYKNGLFHERNQLGLFNTDTTAIVDPDSILDPTATVSAGMAFIPDQVGIGIANLDVFMVQNPRYYGYEMSADTRMGATLLRANKHGAVIYTYGKTA